MSVWVIIDWEQRSLRVCVCSRVVPSARLDSADPKRSTARKKGGRNKERTEGGLDGITFGLREQLMLDVKFQNGLRLWFWWKGFFYQQSTFLLYNMVIQTMWWKCHFLLFFSLSSTLISKRIKDEAQIFDWDHFLWLQLLCSGPTSSQIF